MKANFDYFYDVILFDTTFKTIRLKLSLGIFLRISNNRKNSFLGINFRGKNLKNKFIISNKFIL